MNQIDKAVSATSRAAAAVQDASEAAAGLFASLLRQAARPAHSYLESTARIERAEREMAFEPLPEVLEKDGHGWQADPDYDCYKNLYVTDGMLQVDALADALVPKDGEEGVFEVMFPDGRSIGVDIRMDAYAAHFQLTASDQDLGAALQHRQLELQSELELRMHRSVEISVRWRCAGI